jgi:hypothetical protein
MEAQMKHRISPIFCSAFLFIAAGNPGVAANDNDPPAVRTDKLSASTTVSCSLRTSPVEPFDPPSTSSLLPQDRFVARLYFREDISASADVKISWLGARFLQRYVVKIETEATDVTVRSYTLNRPSNDDEIIAELSGRHETRLTDVWCLLRRHARGQGAGLRSSEAPNLFFVRDASGELGVVDVIWGGAGWEIGASEVGAPRRWPGGSHVVAH